MGGGNHDSKLRLKIIFKNLPLWYTGFSLEQYGPHRSIVQACSFIHYRQSQTISVVCLCHSTHIPEEHIT